MARAVAGSNPSLTPETAEGFEGIIVMPEGGDGWYTDWWNKGTRRDPAWESHHLDQVIRQIEERYPIRPA